MTPTPSPETNDLRPPFAVGMGYDVHAFAEGRKLVLGGVTIPHAKGLLGHSDADVLLHAAMDALLGAASLPDIGHFFPNHDERWRDVDSRVLLREVADQLKKSGWSVGNLDCTLIAEAPKIAPHIAQMKANIAEDLGIAATQIGVKATTNEGMGFVGRKEGIAALATALIYKT